MRTQDIDLEKVLQAGKPFFEKYGFLEEARSVSTQGLLLNLSNGSLEFRFAVDFDGGLAVGLKILEGGREEFYPSEREAWLDDFGRISLPGLLRLRAKYGEHLPARVIDTQEAAWAMEVSTKLLEEYGSDILSGDYSDRASLLRWVRDEGLARGPQHEQHFRELYGYVDHEPR